MFSLLYSMTSIYNTPRPSQTLVIVISFVDVAQYLSWTPIMFSWTIFGLPCMFPGFSVGASTFHMDSRPIWLRNYNAVPHILQLTWETFATTHKRWIGQDLFTKKQKNLAWILSYFSGNLCFPFCSNTLILAPVCGKCILRGPNFQNFLGEHTPWTSLPPTISHQ